MLRAHDHRLAEAHTLPGSPCERSLAMAFFPSVPDADMKHTLAREPAIGMPFSQLNEAVMRGDAPFTAGERELIAAYVSALNGCDYCQCEPAGLHEAVERLHRQGYAGTVQYILAQAEHAGAPRGRGAETLE